MTEDAVATRAVPESRAPSATEVPADRQERARAWADGYTARLQQSVDRYTAALQPAPGPRIGEPTVGSYVAFDIWATTPIQFGGPPPYRPGKIIAAGEWALIFAALFVNSLVDIPRGFAVPPTVQLGGRTYRVRMEQIDLTNVADGPDDTRQATFTAPAPVITPLFFWFMPTDPGPNPRLVEANFTADIVGMAQPYAAFATEILDVDETPPRFRQCCPVRYLVYSK